MLLALVITLAVLLYLWFACWLGRQLRAARIRNFGPDPDDW